jgi:ATP-dependent Clp endopeptidase proteolytic subunit ClpP
MNTELFQIENRAGKIMLNDVVHKDSADKLIDDLSKLYGASAVDAQMCIGDVMCKADDALESVDVEINSPGGSVFEGHRIYNALREISARGVAVTTTVNGLAASMGSVILMAGDNRRMTPGSRIMIHDASTMAYGNAAALKKSADLLEGISAEIAGVYSERTGGDKALIRNLMLAETWMTAEQAKAENFIDEIHDMNPKKEPIDIGSENTNVGSMNLINRLTSPSNEESTARIEALETQILGHDTEVSELQAKLETAEAALQEASAIAVRNTELEAQILTIPTFEAKISELAEKVTTLEAENVVTNEKIEIAAAAKLAAMGHGEPLDLGNQSQTSPALNLLEQYEALEGAEKRDFLAIHAVELRRLALEKSNL